LINTANCQFVLVVLLVILFSFFLYSNYQNTQYISLVCANYLSSYNITYVFLFGTTICYRTAKILFTYNFNTATIQTNNFLFVAHEKYCSSKYSRDDSDVKHRTFFHSYLRHQYSYIKCARPCRETKKPTASAGIAFDSTNCQN
jgi:hypothetical protein